MRRRSFLTGATALPLCGALPGLARAAAPGGRNLILILARGAWDVTYALDPKSPDNPYIHGPSYRSYDGDRNGDEDIATYGGITIAENLVERPSVSSFFNSWREDCLIINGISMRSISHDACRLRILTGGTRDYQPDMGAITGFVHRGDAALGYVDFSGLGRVGSFASSVGMVGNANQLKMLLDMSAGPVLTPGGDAYPLFSFSEAAHGGIQEYLDAAVSRSAKGWGISDADAALLASVEESRAAAGLLRADASTLAGAMELGVELDVADQALLAVQMLTAGLCRSVLIEADLNWDTHQNNQNQGGKFESLFGGMDGLVDTLIAAGLWENTTVAVISDFTRTPRINIDDGKDHWPMGSALLFGGAVEGDRVLGGSTDDTFEAQPVNLETGATRATGDPADFGNLAAGILASLDVDPEEYLPGVEVYRAIAP